MNTPPVSGSEHHLTPREYLVSYPRFLAHALHQATEGGWIFYAWMTLLTALALVGVNAWARQVSGGMGLTNMSDHVSWGLYIANFTFFVGLAAGGVMMVIPAYLYHDDDMHDVVIVGELLAVASIIVCLLFVVVDLGRPDRFWHMMPFVGRFNWPISMLTWDVIVLNGYLLINLHICGYLLYVRFLGERPNPRWYKPFVFLSIVWAISIHTVTAFLYCGLGGRPLWNSAVLAPRFLASAFVSGPAFIILTMMILERVAGIELGKGPRRTLVGIVRVTCLLNLFLLGCELFTEFYTGGAHTSSARYLFLGIGDATALVPWIWTAIGFNSLAAAIFLCPATSRRDGMLAVACVLTVSGVWIEKGMGLIVPGFVPSTLHEIVEWKITVGIWAAGLLAYTAALKFALTVLAERLRLAPATISPGAE